MARRLVNAPDGTPMWWVDLDRVATLAIFGYVQWRTKAYGLLHESGSLMTDQNGPITAGDWPTICRLAQMNSTNWIIFYHDWRVVRVVFTQSGAYTEGRVLLNPESSAVEELQRTPMPEGVEPYATETDEGPPLDEPEPQTHLKGAQKRARRFPSKPR